MRLGNIGKGLAVALAATWLVGCASQGGSSSSTKAVSTEKAVTGAVTKAITDPAVRAVVESGMVKASPEQIKKMLTKKVYNFGFDSDALSQNDYEALDVKAAFMNSEVGKQSKLTIAGHTDERGTRTYNLALGERRANAVKNYLMLKGVGADRIEVISWGFEKPVDPAHNEAAWASNRRAEITTVKDVF